MKRHTALCTLLVLLALAGVACSDEESGPSTGTHIGNPGDLEFRVSSALTAADAAPPTFRDADGTTLQLDEARMVVRDIELYLPDGEVCDDLSGTFAGTRCTPGDDKLSIEGPFVVDLLTRTATPPLDGVQIPPLLYRRVDFRVDDVEDDTLVRTDDPLFGASFFAQATVEDGDPGFNTLRLRLRFNEVARVEHPDGVQVPDAGSLLIDLDAARWLADAPLTSCVEEGGLIPQGGAVTLDDDSDAEDCDLRDDLRDAIEASTRLGAAP